MKTPQANDGVNNQANIGGEVQKQTLEENFEILPEMDIILNDDEANIEFIYGEITSRLDTQLSLFESTQSKAANVMGFSGAIFAFLLGTVQTESPLTDFASYLVIPIMLLILSIFVSSMVFWSRRLRVDPAPNVLLKEYHHKTKSETLLQVAVNKVDAHQYNQERLERSANLVRISMTIQGLAIVSIATIVILTIVSN